MSQMPTAVGVPQESGGSLMSINVLFHITRGVLGVSVGIKHTTTVFILLLSDLWCFRICVLGTCTLFQSLYSVPTLQVVVDSHENLMFLSRDTQVPGSLEGCIRRGMSNILVRDSI